MEWWFQESSGHLYEVRRRTSLGRWISTFRRYHWRLNFPSVALWLSTVALILAIVTARQRDFGIFELFPPASPEKSTGVHRSLPRKEVRTKVEYEYGPRETGRQTERWSGRKRQRVCVYVFVCEKEREREREGGREGRQTNTGRDTKIDSQRDKDRGKDRRESLFWQYWTWEHYKSCAKAHTHTHTPKKEKSSTSSEYSKGKLHISWTFFGVTKWELLWRVQTSKSFAQFIKLDVSLWV